MNRFSWKAGSVFSVAFAVVCMVIYLFLGANVDFACRYTAPDVFGCGAYNAIGVVITAYANFFLQFFAPECVGGGPDSCIGPALAIMLATLLIIGFFLGGMLFRTKTGSNVAQ